MGVKQVKQKEQPKQKEWVRLDNASNIFLAAMSTTDTKVFRLSAEMQDKIDPISLQKALEQTYARYKLYHSVLRRGIFWYYLQHTEIIPKVAPEVLAPCSQLYHFDQKELLFRVIYNEDRVHLEVFHVLSDGTGALWFFEDLIKEYILLRYPESLDVIKKEQIEAKVRHLEDSFVTYFRHNGQQTFTESAQSALRNFARSSKRAAFKYGKKFGRALLKDRTVPTKKRRVYRIKGEKTADNRTKVIELEMPVKKILHLAHQEEATLTIYLIALFFESIRKSKSDFQIRDTIAISVPVNLRQFYPSNSARNFFSTVKLEYTYTQERDPQLKEICASLAEQMSQQLSKESLERRLSRLISYEYNPINRLIPRPIKDGVLKIINYSNNRNLTVAMSNLGRVAFPQSIDGYVNRLYFHTSAVRPQFSVISHGDQLTISFTSPFIDTDIQQQFVRELTSAGIEVTLAANKTQADELRGEF